MKAEEIAEHDPSYQTVLADMWLHLIDGSRVMKVALEHNLLWSPEEKGWWFNEDGSALDRISTERKSMVTCASLGRAFGELLSEKQDMGRDGLTASLRSQARGAN